MIVTYGVKYVVDTEKLKKVLTGRVPEDILNQFITNISTMGVQEFDYTAPGVLDNPGLIEGIIIGIEGAGVMLEKIDNARPPIITRPEPKP